MIVTVTGATGFIGRRIVDRLLAAGGQVHVLGRRKPGSREGVRFFPWDAASGQPPAESLDGVDGILNLAGEPIGQRWNPEVKKRLVSSRVNGTRGLVYALSTISRRPKVLVSTSASGYYGDRGEEFLREDAPPGDGFLADLSVQWEKEAELASALGMRVVIPRVSLALGPDGGALERMILPFKWGVGGRIGSGKQFWPWIHVDDLVELYLEALRNPSWKGPVNACSPETPRNAEFTRVLARHLHRPAILPVPRLGLRIALGELGDSLLSSQRMIPNAALAGGFRFRFPTLEAALDDLLPEKR